MRRALIVVSLVLTGGCVQIDGGAVELSWSIRDFNDSTVSCAAAGISTMRICWQPADDPEIGSDCSRFSEFPCNASRGVSLFEVETGEMAFFVRPRCEIGGGDPQGEFRVAAPIVRTVNEGRVVTLNQILVLVTPPSSCGANGPDPCTCPLP